MPSSIHGFENFGAHGRKLLRFLADRKHALSPFLILTHNFPDPDAIASAYALHYLAEKAFGISSRIAYRGVIGRAENRNMVSLLHLPYMPFQAGDLKKFQHVALVDTQPGFKNNGFPPQRRATLVIDQHTSLSPPLADLAIVDEGCGATCVIVAQALLLSGLKIPERLATALAYGIITDTQNLYRATRPDVIQTYLSILPRANIRWLSRIQNPSRTKNVFVTLGRGMQQAQVCQRLVVAHLGPVDSPDLVALVADFLLSYQPVKWALGTGRYKGHLYLSLRTDQTTVPAERVIRAMVPNPKDAGGHDRIAGGSVKVGLHAPEPSWREVEARLTEKLVQRLKIPRRFRFRYPFRSQISRPGAA